jgi:phosphoenolpyruvate carboxykinase (ATP)
MASSQNIHIPPGLPRESGPLYSDFFEQQVAKQRNNNYHSTSLVNMVATSVNRTALHPGGVQPGNRHTELEEELHEHAHIDYNRVAIVCVL